MVCKGFCLKYKATKSMNGHYADGHFRCQICVLFLLPEGVTKKRTCKCCGYKVRGKPRNSTIKKNLREKIPHAF